MTRSFWLGAGAGTLVTAAVAVSLHARLREGDASLRSRPESNEAASTQQLRAELAAVREELAQARAQAARERAASPALGDSPEAGLERGRTAIRASVPQPERPEPIPEWERLIARGDLGRAAEVLSAALEQGDITKLELMQLAVQHPELVIEGLNDYDLPDAFRSVLIDTLSSLEDPLTTISGLDLEREPNQRFAARIAAILAQSVERGARADARAVAAIEKLLAGNEMQGEKVNLYPVLAQLGALGDRRAQALLQDADLGIFAPGIRSLLDPPARDERGAALTGALVFSVQYNKGQWENRPRQLQSGDIVVSIDGERVTSAPEFSRLLKKQHGLGALEFVEAGIFRPSAGTAGSLFAGPFEYAPFEYAAVQLDPGDLQLMYGVYTVKRP